MAVQVVQGKRNGILSNLGTLAQLGGMAIPGAGWLTPLGMGMKAADTLINGTGDSDTAIDALGTLKDTITGWKNPASGNIAKVAGKVSSTANRTRNMPDDNELSRKWSGSRWQQ